MIKSSTIELQKSIYNYPTLLKRIQAVFIDLLLILTVFALTSTIINAIGDIATAVKIAVFISCVILYEPVFVAFMGGTLGHKVMGMRIKKHDKPEENISILSAILRVIVKSLLGWISFLTVTLTSEKRALHDMASGSIVVMK